MAVTKGLEEMGCSTRFYMEAACVWEGKQKWKVDMKVRRRGKKAWEEQVGDQEWTTYEEGAVWLFLLNYYQEKIVISSKMQLQKFSKSVISISSGFGAEFLFNTKS